MEKFIMSVKDLVIQAMTNIYEIKTEADKGDAESCFKMGMIHLLGINTAVSFKKASKFLEDRSLSGDKDAICLLGYIAECEGDFSYALQCFSKNAGNENDSYIDKVIKGRNLLKNYLKTLNLPISLNEEISSILKDYCKGNSSKTGASVKIAAICNDEQTCIEAAKCLSEAQDYISAIDWLKRGKVEQDNPLYITINKKLRETTINQLNSKDLLVINLESNSLLFKEAPTSFLTNIKKTCDAASMKCSIRWKEKTKPIIDRFINDLNDQAYLDFLAEEEEAKRRRMGRILIGVLLFVVLIFLASIIPSSDKSNDINEPKEEYVLNGRKILHGVVDKYPVTMELQIDENTINGSLYYDKYGPQNILILSGVLNINHIKLEETEKNGKSTGSFDGNYTDGVFQGEYIKINGKSMPFKMSDY